jgi:hypothetical protein
MVVDAGGDEKIAESRDPGLAGFQRDISAP